MTEISSESELQPPETQATTNWKRFFRDLLETLFLAVVLFLAINAISARVRVDGHSMRPTLEDGEFVLVSRLTYKFNSPQRGDIIVFRYPMNPKEDYIKRVIGLPGEDVRIENGSVYINDMPIDEPYIAASPIYAGSWQVPEGFILVLGDNRNESSDSHQWGLVPMENLVGKALVVYWPPLKWSILDHGIAAAATP